MLKLAFLPGMLFLLCVSAVPTDTTNCLLPTTDVTGQLPVFRVIPFDAWKHVLLTDDPEDISGMVKKGEVTVTTPAGRSRRDTERNAGMRLKMQALRLGAEIILITDTDTRGGYGDVPSISITGIAYGYPR